MKITAIEMSILTSPFEYGMASEASDSRGPKYAFILKVHTDEGITGIADCDSHPHIMKAFIEAPSYLHAFSEGLKYAVIGENPFEYDKIWTKMYQSSFYQGRRGAAIHAMSAIDIAIWDIIGKATGQPVCVMLGGRNHEKIKAYASTLFRNTPEEMIDAAQKYRSLGFKAVKFGWGAVTEDPSRVVPLVEAIRKGIGNDMDILVDGMWTSDVKLAIQLVKELGNFNVFFVEEPLKSDNLEGYKKLANAVDVRIACGEQLAGLYEYKQLLIEGDVDIIQPDVSRAGGLTEVRKLVTMVEQAGKLLIPHAWTSDILTAASLHLNSYQKNPVFQEFCTNDTPLSRELVINPLVLDSDGYVHVPTAPGLGVELNEEVIRKYTTDHLIVTN
ncbi:mandelate racemase/muconate lactonizing enzyme family protein [Paenibacillus psychroresistens]|uniref:Mandelate racemase/muconate lactonizing enzyme family protein n=1 Tax=Paenibacillus psychroresistens TaxID=1778678 RepID=A0A6B8RH97_9BACL|nr:mandelate racemase/muconate lactonizing enzyme family protein [Paenibacillus psychroresistens]QGQ94766.1 mandelate racemase/muconate lactonizing enzyme family protein [Paenibacillus psychroresistens]